MAVKSYQNFDPIAEVDACGCSGIRFDINLNGWVKVTPPPTNGGADCAELEAKVTQLQQTIEQLNNDKSADQAEIARLTEELAQCRRGGGLGEIRTEWAVGMYTDATDSYVVVSRSLLAEHAEGPIFFRSAGAVSPAELQPTTLPEEVKERWYTAVSEKADEAGRGYDLSLLTTNGVYYKLPARAQAGRTFDVSLTRDALLTDEALVAAGKVFALEGVEGADVWCSPMGE